MAHDRLETGDECGTVGACRGFDRLNFLAGT